MKTIEKRNIVILKYKNWIKVNSLFLVMKRNIWMYIDQVNKFNKEGNLIEISILNKEFISFLEVNKIEFVNKTKFINGEL